MCEGRRMSIIRTPKFRTLVFLNAIAFLLAMSGFANAADSNCEYYKIRAPILDVLKDPRRVGDYAGELKRDDIVCVTKKRKVGRRTWGQVDHALVDGERDKLNGWVSLRFLKPHKLSKTSQEPKKKTAPSSSAYAPKRQAPKKSKVDTDRAAEVAYWNTVRESNDPDLLASYLDQYPNGAFAKLARLLLSKIDRDEETEGPRANAEKVSKPERRLERQRSTREREQSDSRKTARRERVRRDRRRSERRRSSERRRRSEQRRARQARSQRSQKRRKRRPKCRTETRWECIKRGGNIDSSTGDCDVKRVCR